MKFSKHFPEGIIINSDIFKQSDFIKTSINNVVEALRDGAVLVIIVIFLFLWNIRTTFISVLAIPLSLIITIIIFQFFDIMINTMTLGGMAIAIGALVDDAIIDVENVFRRLKENSRKPEEERLSSLTIII
jgi:copper/silver efflux system protein